MHARSAAHNRITPDRQFHARRLAADDVVDRAAFHLIGIAGHDDVTSRFQRYVAKEPAIVRSELHDTRRVLNVWAPIIIERGMRQRLPRLSVDRRTGDATELIREHG